MSDARSKVVHEWVFKDEEWRLVFCEGKGGVMTVERLNGENWEIHGRFAKEATGLAAALMGGMLRALNLVRAPKKEMMS